MSKVTEDPTKTISITGTEEVMLFFAVSAQIDKVKKRIDDPEQENNIQFHKNMLKALQALLAKLCNEADKELEK